MYITFYYQIPNKNNSNYPSFDMHLFRYESHFCLVCYYGERSSPLCHRRFEELCSLLRY